MGPPNMDGLAYLMTVPAGVAVGLVGSVGIALTVGATWWLIAPPVAGFYAGVKAAEYLNRSCFHIRPRFRPRYSPSHARRFGWIGT